MSRREYELQAPEGVTESEIDGTYYVPDAATGTVKTTNETHKKTLELHGYVLVGNEALGTARAGRGLILTEELGRADLSKALAERSIAHDAGADRATLAALADRWNDDLRGIKPPEPAPAPAPEPVAAPVAPAPAVEPAPLPSPPPPPPSPPAPAPAAQQAAPEALDDEVIVDNNRPDFENMAHNDRRAWLKSAGIEAPGSINKPDLLALVVKHWDAGDRPKPEPKS